MALALRLGAALIKVLRLRGTDDMGLIFWRAHAEEGTHDVGLWMIKMLEIPFKLGYIMTHMGQQLTFTGNWF